MYRRSTLLAALSLLVAAGPLPAQLFPDDSEPLGPPRVFGGLVGVVAIPQGEFADSVDVGFGLDAYLLFQVTPDGPLALRLDGGLVNYGRERMRVPLSNTIGGRVLVDVTTSNNIFFLGVGPQWMTPSGRLRPYAHASVGLAYFQTESSVQGTRSNVDFASTTNFDDLTFSWGGGAGVYVPVRAGNTPIAIDLGVRYRDNGEASYLREGSIRDTGDGDIAFTPIRTEANLLSFYVGVSVGLRDHDRDR